ncbi:transcriptional regulator [Bradyrhizobium sp. NAS80.1]|uniref:response regulator transcription factor n=1 Tax=Bradyrhizobium sp. NAS80.1 TaxID=1680159 RepID=UPI00096351D2|nr:response regulator transcription factor [Bradyrhizobium sp. NAS80.1]OKO86059.1 transcriptional regulator [Bradyrhizobium sp. NAS80.1]
MTRRYSFATVLVGQNNLRREGLARILHAANFRILASISCADGLDACKVKPCQLFFLIVHTGDDFDASVEQIERLRDRHPDGRIAVVADRYQLSELVSAFHAGATGYFVDVMSCDALIKSIELVMMGETVFPPAFALGAGEIHPDKTKPLSDSEVTLDAPDDRIAQQLSPREKSILRCLIEGDSNKCIARKINITEATVKVHIKAILRKIRVQNRTQAAIWGINNRFLAWPLNTSSPPQVRDDTGDRFPSTVREIPEIKRIVSHASNDFEVPGVHEHMRKQIDVKANGAIRFRK